MTPISVSRWILLLVGMLNSHFVFYLHQATQIAGADCAAGGGGIIHGTVCRFKVVYSR